MHRVYHVNTGCTTAAELTWPELCPACGQPAPPNDTGGISLAFVPIKDDKPHNVRLCSECSQKWKRRQTLENIGYGGAGIVVLSAVILPAARANLGGAGAAFWLFILIGLLGKAKRGALTIRTGVLRDGNISISFPSKTFQGEFIKANPNSSNNGSDFILW